MINEKCLKYPDVRLIGKNGEQVGIVRTREALDMAKDAGVDLVLVAENARPPVCRIVDYGKHRYEIDKKQKEGKAKSKPQDVKGIKLRPGTAKSDLEVRVKRTEKFLKEGNKVRFTVQFRSREITHPEIAREQLKWILDRIETPVIVEKEAGIEGRMMTMVISPDKKATTAKSNGKESETQNVQDSGEAVQDNRDRQDTAAQGI